MRYVVYWISDHGNPINRPITGPIIDINSAFDAVNKFQAEDNRDCKEIKPCTHQYQVREAE